MYKFHYRLSELEEMIPFERNIYTLLLEQEIEKENEEMKQANG